MTNRQNWANRGVDPYKNMTWDEKILEDAVDSLLIEIERLRKKDYIKEIADKSLRYEEGRLQGMKDMRRLIWYGSELPVVIRISMSKTETAIDNSILEQAILVQNARQANLRVTEIQGEEE
jgi:hypothetical protein